VVAVLGVSWSIQIIRDTSKPLGSAADPYVLLLPRLATKGGVCDALDCLWNDGNVDAKSLDRRPRRLRRLRCCFAVRCSVDWLSAWCIAQMAAKVWPPDSQCSGDRDSSEGKIATLKGWQYEHRGPEMPYLYIVIPLTLLSAYLILIPSRKRLPTVSQSDE
jgi:hypothetical protein